MVPEPDHGEDSYRGFGRLGGCRALITGADSGIGRAVAIAFAREGADVVLNHLPSEEADAEEVAGLVKAARCRAVAPGPMRTLLQPSGGQPQEKIPDFGAQVPLGRPGQPAGLASIYVLLALQESSFATGEVYGVMGGNHLP